MASFALLSDPHHNGCRECSAEAYFFQPWLVQCLCLSAEPAHTACTLHLQWHRGGTAPQALPSISPLFSAVPIDVTETLMVGDCSTEA